MNGLFIWARYQCVRKVWCHRFQRSKKYFLAFIHFCWRQHLFQIIFSPWKMTSGLLLWRHRNIFSQKLSKHVLLTKNLNLWRFWVNPNIFLENTTSNVAEKAKISKNSENRHAARAQSKMIRFIWKSKLAFLPKTRLNGS